MKVTLDELQTFATVVDAGSITAAAQQLGQTVSGTSRTLGRLEEKLQTTLLRRTTRRLELTEEGRAFLGSAREIIEAVEGAEEQMVARRERPSGRLRVDAATPFVLHVIAPLVAGYRERYPQVELELNSNEGIIDLLERRTDVAIRIGPLKDSTLHSRPIGVSRLRVLASPAYLDRYGQPRRVEELGRHVRLGFNQPESLNVWPLLGPDNEPYRVVPTIWASSGETLRHLALEGVGIVCLSDFMTREDRDTGRLVPLFAQQTQDVRQPINAVYYRNTAISSRIASFVDYLAKAVAGTEMQG
ncbi:LysR family transcriptional regulator [Paraburkholderia caballeronis]|uniref:DNA-binding transcriptional regulator, LysR family n=1 Tax=Paraburkholderia caballeronis TaxID=416943 RepID=A0A1H7RJV1_9BURK|nr:LysR family transcriptional regulator [Paraburkholderia caballeronis]PXW23070.1 DNA-binding transcriptional LysR family regulator [Paraburkholderia caballeronis]PXW97734.1 DNA-binding transcriptional LysR family regulator [Paraburkholderia caballeronis]RAJ94704.1 DNA-binding transcriptional LysR family regulator [Paraburkholderia caballeronis]TDV11767.1 DNA-binding transcriptional LysR family regulator [Paraburkholderia caballeronis]TDV14848.1 DNA-binding transcriptional LysR family regulat